MQLHVAELHSDICRHLLEFIFLKKREKTRSTDVRNSWAETRTVKNQES